MAAKNKRLKSQVVVKSSEKLITFQEDEKESLAFKVLSTEQTQIVVDCSDVDELHKKMAEILELTDYPVDTKIGAQLDYFVSGMIWAKEYNFSSEQTSALFTVLHTLLDNVKEKHLSTVDNMTCFKKMFAGVGMDNCELSGGLELFDVKQATLISEYMHQSFFQHYLMYEFLFDATPAEEIIGTDLVIEVPFPADMPWPPPLEEAVTRDTYMAFVAAPLPPSPEKEEEAVVEEEEGECEVEKSEEEMMAEGELIVDLMAQLTTEQITATMDNVFEEMLVGLKTDVANKLRVKENDFISRINKIHRVSSAKK